MTIENIPETHRPTEKIRHQRKPGNKAQPKKPISVRGIWKNKGFEKIDVEQELKDLRKDIQSKLDSKEL